MTIYIVSLKEYGVSGGHLVRGFRTPEDRLSWCRKVYRWISESQNRDIAPIEGMGYFGDYKFDELEVK